MKARTLGMAAILAFLAWAFFIEPPSRTAAVWAANLRVEAQGVKNCVGCHEGFQAKGIHTQAWLRYQQAGSTDFIRLDEYDIWHSQDLHSKAFANIQPKYNQEAPANLAARMEKRLEYKIQEKAECLVCHATDLGKDDSKRFHTSDGVSCEACHGVAESWVGEHFQLKWRTLQPEAKEAKGLRDLRNPQKRAELCVSCHVGNKEEGKFVTHEMYAAGHPPLPPFELLTYSRDQPRHAYPADQNKELLKLAGADPADAWKRFHYRTPEEESAETRNWVVGMLASVQASVRSLEVESATLKKEGGVLDFAHFDCYACHHDLKVDSDRQKKRPNAGGRPYLKPSGLQFLDIIAAQAGRHAKGPKASDPARLHEKLLAAMADLAGAVRKRPFGEPDEIHRTAGRLAEETRLLRDAVDEMRYSKELSKELIEKLAESLRSRHLTPNSPLDHDTAQLYAWSLIALRNADRPPDGKKIDGWETQLKILNGSVKVYFRSADENDLYELKSVEEREEGRLDLNNKFKFSEYRSAMEQLLPFLK